MNQFQKIYLQLTEYFFHYFLRAKSVKVFIVKIIVENLKLSNIQMHIITLLKIDF
jgi:hypothetical protein